MRYAVGTLRIDDVVGAQPGVEWQPGQVVAVDFFLGSGDFETYEPALTGLSGMWFLLDKQLEGVRLGTAISPDDKGLYMLSASRGFIRDVQGGAQFSFSVPDEFGDESDADPLMGEVMLMRFDELEASVKGRRQK